MKSTFLVLVLALAALGMPCFAGAVHLTGNVSADFLGGNSAPQIINTFTVGDQPLFWGFGWEVIIDHFGFGGDYLVSFYQDAGEHWWLDWYAPALFLSFHPLGGRSFLDPFLQVGIGSSGRVLLEPQRMPVGTGPTQNLSLSLFPFVGGGLALNIESLLLSAKVVYTPYSSQIPVTDIPSYPLGKFQVTLSAGISLGW
ncbi:MAG: hypothetical protein ABSB63_11120 [Spirochaetia bacterium]|jgi:hypothetical protein